MENEEFDTDATRRRQGGPYTQKKPIPTIQRYREQRKEIRETEDAQNREPIEGEEEAEDAPSSKTEKAKDAVKGVFGLNKPQHLSGEVYETENHNVASQQEHPPDDSKEQDESSDNEHDDDDDDDEAPPPVPEKDQGDAEKPQKKADGEEKSAAEAAAGLHDPKQKRKAMKHRKRQEGGREVTDPVTHLPIVIHDATDKTLKRAPENEPPAGSEPATSTGLNNAMKSQEQLDQEQEEDEDGLRGMESLYPPPEYNAIQGSLIRVYKFALTVGLGCLLVLFISILLALQILNIIGNGGSPTKSYSHKGTNELPRLFVPIFSMIVLAALTGGVVIWGLRGWLEKKVESIWEDQLWDAAREAEKKHSQTTSKPESTNWLTSLLASVWPLINPDLFTSLADTLEDTMQASIPKMVRMVSIDDLGQGSESIRILGVRWLPTGAAARTVDTHGKLKGPQGGEADDRTNPGEGQIERSTEDNNDNDDNKDKGEKKPTNKADEQDRENIDEGMEGEQGDFVNVEIAFAYRAMSTSKSLKTKANNAHLLVRFFLPSNIAVPVWVEMRGLVGTMRLRMQLTPDPPFFSLATLTFMGQPKADISCVPLLKHNVNIMDLPLISSFVQSSIDAALAEYVAPKSLTLDIKQMISGDDFKKDTVARGAVVVRIRKAYDFKEGDTNLGPVKHGSSDPYCTVSWGKFGKPMFSSRIIVDEMRPSWDEWAAVLVGPEELNAEEILRVQLWDSDRGTADDDLGRVEIPLKEIMKKEETKGRLEDRTDRFAGSKEGEMMPGNLEWSVGYFAKTKITPEQLAKQSAEPDIKTVDDLKKRVSENAERKLREATSHDESKEIAQQKAQDYAEREENLIISSPPPDDYPSGILSIQIHQITGLELEALRNKEDDKHEMEESDDLPSAYCTIMLNHVKIYRTRTKPKSAKPFFNAGTERFIRDWKTTEVMIAARDSRVHENDPLLGIVYLPLTKLFRHRSQVMDTFPLAGGVGYGRARISLVFRSIQLQLPRELTGWDYGTVDVHSGVKSVNLPSDLQKLRLRVSTGLSKSDMKPSSDKDSGSSIWTPRKGRDSLFLPVKKRYSTSLTFQFCKTSVGPDNVAAWAVFWLKDIVDDEEQTIKIPVWAHKGKNMKRGQNCVEFDNDQQEQESKHPLGELELTLKVWRGLSGYHKAVADKGRQQDMRDVMEVLDAINDTYGRDSDSDSDHGDTDSSSPSRSRSSSSSHRSATPPSPTPDGSSLKSHLTHALQSTTGTDNDQSSTGTRGPLDSVRDYQRHHKQLHRKHRGIMQWKAVRSLDWAKHKAVDTRDRTVLAVGRRRGKGGGVETEV